MGYGLWVKSCGSWKGFYCHKPLNSVPSTHNYLGMLGFSVPNSDAPKSHTVPSGCVGSTSLSFNNATRRSCHWPPSQELQVGFSRHLSDSLSTTFKVANSKRPGIRRYDVPDIRHRMRSQRSRSRSITTSCGRCRSSALCKPLWAHRRPRISNRHPDIRFRIATRYSSERGCPGYAHQQHKHTRPRDSKRRAGIPTCHIPSSPGSVTDRFASSSSPDAKHSETQINNNTDHENNLRIKKTPFLGFRSWVLSCGLRAVCSGKSL